jgi:hypothetical protein
LVEAATYSLLSDAPLSEIRTLRRGLLLGVLCLLAAPVMFYFAGVSAAPAMGVQRALVHALAIVSLTWALAVWMMTPTLQTPDGVKRGFAEGSRLRHVARWAQMGWPAAMALVVSGVVAGPIGAAAFGLSLIVGLVGLMALAMMLMRLADWAADSWAERMLNWTLFIMPVCVAVLALTAAAPIFGLLACAAGLFLLSAALTFGLALVSLTGAVSWCVYHAQARLEREKREREKMVNPTAARVTSREPIALSDEPAETGTADEGR